MRTKISIIYGTSGAGKSTLAEKVSRDLDKPNVIGTEMLRQIMKTNMHQKKYCFIRDNTYYSIDDIAKYEQLSEKERWKQIMRNYFQECYPVIKYADSLLNRTVEEGKTLVLKGVHMNPHWINNLPVYKNNKELFDQYLVFVGDSQTHMYNFIKRAIDNPKRDGTKYLNNFQEVRWVHDYLCKTADRYKEIKKIDNSVIDHEKLGNMPEIRVWMQNYQINLK